MSQLLVDDIVNKDDSGSPGFSKGAVVTGIVTATTLKGTTVEATTVEANTIAAGAGGTVTVNTGAGTGTPRWHWQSAGHLLPTSNADYDIGSAEKKVRHLFLSDNSLKFVDDSNNPRNLSVTAGGNLKFDGGFEAATATFAGNVSVGGTLTYEDVNNIDSVGLITARNGIDVLAGISTFQGVDNEKRVTEKINVVSGTAIDCSAGNYYTKTVTGATAFTFTNVPTSVAYFLTIEVTCNGSNAVTWPASVKWPADTAPAITDGKTTLFMFVTDDGGTRWRGSSLADYTN